MVKIEKKDHALHALHRVLTTARRMALEAQPAQRIAEVLDWAELLPRLLASPEDKTVEFRDTLQAIIEKQPDLQYALSAFDCDERVRW